MVADSQAHFEMRNLTLCLPSESYLGSRVHWNAERAKKTQDRVHEWDAHPLRWCLLVSSLPDPNRFQECSRDGRSFSPAKQSLHCWRVAARDPLSNHSWSRTDRDHIPVASQWRLPILERAVGLSQRYYPATLPAAPGATGLAQVASAARSLLDEDERQATPAFTSALRFRLHRPGGLWSAARSSQGLQSAQARKEMLQPAALFRRTDKGLLAWRIASRRCLHFQRCFSSAYRLFCQDSHRHQTDYNPCRQRVLRPQNYRVAGKQKSWLHHLRQAHPTPQTEAFGTALYTAKQKPLHCRISLPTAALEKTLSLCRGAASPRRRGQQPAYLIQAGQIFLPGIRHQSRTEAGKPLALLQWSRSDRTNYPRTQRKLSLGPNSHAPFPRQRSLLSSLIVGLQPGELVQAPLPARRVSNSDTRDLAPTDLSDASAIAPRQQSSSAGHANQWSEGERLEI